MQADVALSMNSSLCFRQVELGVQSLMSQLTAREKAALQVLAYLAVHKQSKEGNGLLCAVLIHAWHVEVIQEHHEALAHRWPIGVLCALLCPILISEHRRRVSLH